MYWGNPETDPTSSCALVFDTAKGFQGGWHLAGEDYAIVNDATGNHYHGTAYSTIATTGAIGNAYRFDGSSSHITIDSTADSKLNIPQNGTYSMSLWAYARTIDTLWRAIAGKGHEQYYMQFKGLGNNRATWEFQDKRGGEYTEDSVPPAPGAGAGVYIVGIRNGSDQQLYINGEKVIERASLMKGDYLRVSDDDFTIGSFERPVTIPQEQGMSYFCGMVDEVRVMDVLPDASRIKRCYMNQKMVDALVEFR